MRELLISGLLAVGVSISSFAGSFSVTVNPGTLTNLYSFGPNSGSLVVKTVSIGATTATNTSLIFVDTPTNSIVYTNGLYYNRIGYATNYVYNYTNFYGVNVLYTNFAYVTLTNTVPAGTNTWPVKGIFGAGASATAYYAPVGLYFDNGVWVTNNSSGVAVVTVTY